MSMQDTTLTLTPENFWMGIAEIYQTVLAQGTLIVTLRHTENTPDISIQEYLWSKLYEHDSAWPAKSVEDTIQELTSLMNK